MKNLRIILLISVLCISLPIFSQQIGDGTTVNITNFDQPIPSGMYSKRHFLTTPGVGGIAYIKTDFLISAKSLNHNVQLKVVSPDPRLVSKIPVTDKLYYRISNNSSIITNNWVEVASCGYNIFTGDQIIQAKLGINTDDPTYQLDVIGTGRFTNNLFISGKIGIKTTTPTYDLDVNGVIRAKEVRVETGWADFVFDKSYELPALSEVKAHIEEHKHLPGMPTAAEVKENGIGLSEATTLLLQKVEELTLYTIQQNEKIEMLENELNQLKNQK